MSLGINEPDQPYGQRLLINIVDERAAREPDRTYIFSPVSASPKDGWKPISYKQLANAVNHVAHELARRAENSSDDDEFPTLAYVGPSDVRYIVFMLGCIKASHKALFVSPKANPQSAASLFKATKCRTLYVAGLYLEKVMPWMEMHPMRIVAAPSPEVWLNSSPPHFSYDKSFEEARWDPLVVVHTSGTSGPLKPIIVRQGSLAIMDSLRTVSPLHGTPSAFVFWCSAAKFFVPTPLYHISGAITLGGNAIYYGMPLVLSVEEWPLSPTLVIDSLACSDADACLLPPSMIQALASTEEGIEALAALKFVGYAGSEFTRGGGNLNHAVGNMLTDRGVFLTSMIGCTEAVIYNVHHQANPKLWQWNIFNCDSMGARFRAVNWAPDIFELLICRDSFGEPGQKSLFYTFPNKTEWSTGDLFQRHPTLRDHWRLFSRVEDIVVLSDGTKISPVPAEEMVMSHPGVNGALVVGDQRARVALILEPRATHANSEAAGAALINAVWPLVEEANKVMLPRGQITRDLVVLSDPARPFMRAAKGTVQRSLTLKAYCAFIDSLYQKAGE